MMENEMLNFEELNQVNGGTFDANMYSKDEYKAAGIALDSHFFAKDEFFLWSSVDQNGNKLTSPKRYSLTYDAANTAVEIYNRTGKPATLEEIKNAIGGNILR